MRTRQCPAGLLAWLIACCATTLPAQSPAAMKILTDLESGRLQGEIANRPGGAATVQAPPTQNAQPTSPQNIPTQRQLKTLGVTKQSLPDHSQSQCLDLKRLAEGQTGFVDYWQFEVMQIASPTEMVLKLPGQNIVPVLLANYPVADCSVGDRAKLVGQVQVIGTRPFAITGNKIFVIQFRSDEQAGSGDKPLRTWTDSTGKYKFEASFVELKSGVAKLQGQDGKVKEVPLTKLSPLDQTWVRDHLRSRKR
jgi:SLA1 homology domain 1, SHD1